MGKLILRSQSTHEGTEKSCVSRAHTPFALSSGICEAHNAQISSKIWTSRVTCEKLLTVSALRRLVRSPFCSTLQGTELRGCAAWINLILEEQD